MKILILSAANNIHTVRWANAFYDRGHEVIVVSCCDHKEEVNNFRNGILVKYLKYKSGVGYYLNKKQLSKAVKEINPDVINVHYASGYGTLARVSKLNNYLLNLWGSDIYLFPSNCIKKRILVKNLEYATYISSTTYCMALEAKKYTKKDMFVVPFGVNINNFVQVNKNNKGKIIFGTIKSLEDVYGIDFLINVFSILNKILKEKNIEYEYRIYGKGSKKEEYQSLINKLNLSENVRLMGYIPNNDVPKVLCDIDIFLLGSKSESFGVSAIEAMASKVPVIATKVDGFKEIIEDGYSGLLIDYNNLKDYANACLKLVENEEFRINIAENAYSNVIEKYDWNRNVSKMIENLINISKEK